MSHEISLDRARDYYDIMQVTYGPKFISQFNGMTDLNRILTIINGALATVTDNQYAKGMAILNAKAGSGEFCPTLSDFKSWCMSGAWWSFEKAWLAACRFTTLKKVKTVEIDGVSYCKDITHEAKLALDQVNRLITSCRMKEAENLFKKTYEELVAKAQIQGRQQEWYVPHVMLDAPKTNDVAPIDQLPKTNDQEQITALTTQYMQDGMSYKAALDKAQMEVRGSVKPIFKGVA